jgi:hypothetical protein
VRAVVLRAARRLGHRGALLVLLGGIALLYGVSLLTVPPSPHPAGLRLLLSRMDLHGWGITLIVAGAVAVLYAPARQGRDWPGFTALVLVWLPWSLSYFVSWWPQGDNARGWVTGAIFAIFAAVPAVGATWDEPEPVPRIKRGV